MDVLRVDRDTFIPNDLIEGYSSMIWTEKYLDPSEFVMKTPLVATTRKLLPEMSLITIRDSNEVMFVENHSIEKNSEGFPELAITGRSLDAFGEFRYLEGAYRKDKYKMARSYTAAEAATVLLWNCFVNPSVNDVTRSGPWERSVLDNIPNIVISDSTDIVGTSRRRWLVGGQVYPQITDLLRQNKLGFRTIRPDSNPAKIASVSTGDKGIISYTNPSSTNKLRFDIYNGTDRRRQQSVKTPVIFHYAAGHIEDPSYLFSVEDFMTMAYVISDVGVRRVYRDKPEDKNLAGLDRRVVWVDGGNPELNENEPTANKTQAEINAENAAIKAEFLEDLPEVGEVELEKHERIELFEGTISPNSPYEYNKHYFLGDKVTLLGEYDFDQTMRVSEYIRTEDAEGDRGYPGLVVTL